ncbi:MAG: PD-(D/E)XK nuclease family protein [Armatimonadota bacterium]|nr:MAG: PD-(D/E)XK nuclease family protein [Armatimonadota bacterium]
MHAAHYNAWLGRDQKRPAECASPAPPYADALADRELLAALESRDRPYSPAELERYLICPYLYYCEKLLELQPLEREIAPVDYGLLLHDVLARLYRDLHEQGRGAVDVAALDPEQVVARAWELLDECLMRQPRFANLPGAQRDIERQSLHGILTRFLCADLEQTAKRDLRPAYFELQFGSPRRSSADERSQPGPLDLGTTGERSVLIAGRMDRVDLTPEGAALIVDYKLGKDTPDMRGVKDGLLFQAPLYAMAAREIFGLDLAGAEYVSLRSGERKGMYRDPSLPLRKSGHNLILSDDDFDATLTGAANAARACIERIRRGEMPRGPRDECPTYCAYRSICRMDAWTLRRIQAERGTRDAG